jgi:uncharacterized protein with FMN-binding domain
MKTKQLATAALAAVTMLGTLSVPTFAAGSIYKDGTFRGTATVQPNADNDFDAYSITVNVTTSGGEITDIQLDSSSTVASDNQTYLERAMNGRGSRTGVFTQIKTNNGTSGVNTVSGATCSSNAIIAAANSALASAATSDSGNGNNTNGEKSDPVYVLMNIPYSEFYAGEGIANVDTVSSATKAKTRSSLVDGSYHSATDGSSISGVIYPVKVNDASVLKSLKQMTESDTVSITVSLRGKETTTEYKGKDALFENADHAYYLLSEQPTYYKELTVGANGSFQFSKAVGTEEAKTAEVKLRSGSATRYGDYQLNFDGLFGDTTRVFGAIVRTKEGGAYAMRHLENIWRKNELAFSTGHTMEPHGNELKTYPQAEGQTVTGVTFFTSDGIENVTLSNPAFLAPVIDDFQAGTPDTKTVALYNLPTDIKDAKATITYREGTGREAKTVTVAENAAVQNGTVSLGDATLAEDTQYTVALNSSNYATVSDTFKLSKTMFRLYNPNSGEHFYTSDAQERANVIKAGWNDEGIGWFAPNSGDAVYRVYNAVGGEHHYTTSKDERDTLVKAGWNDEGIGWYSDANQTVTIYRQYNPNQFANNHNFTKDAEEKDHLISIGWKDEGIAWYAVE